MNPNEWELAKHRRQDMIREAEQHNRAQEARRSRNKPSRYASVMANVGQKMVAIGETLQERYGDFCEEAQGAEA
jgi:hypothetical protein